MLKKFEEYLKKAPKNQKIMIFAMPALVLGAIVWYLVLPMQEERIDILSQEISQLQNNIKRKSPSMLRKKIKKSQKRLMALKSEYEQNRDDLNYLYARLTNLEISEFDAKKWTITLDAILKESLKLGITLQNIKNNDAKEGKKSENIIAKKYVEISGVGNYDKAVRYLAFIEDSGFLIDVKNIRMERAKEDENRVEFAINFTIYGVNL
ncbi:MAG: hypothetical protein B6D59_01155 [Campylobacteraceae bacterium 4484_4]|nr:MAG: hypothetical protein B6D59_01155 [Campylobacteraceae bacterium 4484_4]